MTNPGHLRAMMDQGGASQLQAEYTVNDTGHPGGTVYTTQQRRQAIVDLLKAQGPKTQRELWEVLKEPYYRRKEVTRFAYYSLAMEGDLNWLCREAFIYPHTASGERRKAEVITWSIEP